MIAAFLLTMALIATVLASVYFAESLLIALGSLLERFYWLPQ